MTILRTTGNSGFGQVTGGHSPRRIQLARSSSSNVAPELIGSLYWAEAQVSVRFFY
jgi:hypothetical protein